MFDYESEGMEMYAHLYNGIPIHKQGEFAEYTRVVLHLGHAHKHKGDIHVKLCACGKKHTITDWFASPKVGHYSFPELGTELRNCTKCGSTLTMVIRRGAVSKPLSQTIKNCYMYRPVSDTRPPFTLQQAISINIAFRNMKMLRDFDVWEERQLLEAAMECRPPEWKLRDNGILTPVY